MKRPVIMLSMIAAAAFAAPAAMAGNEVVKCVDAGGHVTLTDRPCGAGSTTVRLSQEGMSAAPAAPQRHVLPAAELRHGAWQRPAAAGRAAAALSRDVATLKEARRTLLLQAARPRLAGLN